MTVFFNNYILPVSINLIFIGITAGVAYRIASCKITAVMLNWLNTHWEWYFVIMAMTCVGIMLNDLTTAPHFYFIGFGFVIPPFCVLAWFLVNMNPATIILNGGPMRFNVYFKLVGWAVYVAMIGFMLGAEPSGKTLSEVLNLRYSEIQKDIWPMTGIYAATLIVTPIALFFWTKQERKNPTLHAWDFNVKKIDAELKAGEEEK